MLKQLMLVAMACGSVATPLVNKKEVFSTDDNVIIALDSCYEIDGEFYFSFEHTYTFHNDVITHALVYQVVFNVGNSYNFQIFSNEFDVYFNLYNNYLVVDNCDLPNGEQLYNSDLDDFITFDTMKFLNGDYFYAFDNIGFIFNYDDYVYNIQPLALKYYSYGKIFSDIDHMYDYGVGYNGGYNSGYQVGYQEGIKTGESLKTGILAIPDALLYIFQSMFNFEILGINLYYILTGLVTIALVLWVIKKVRG